MSEKRIFARHSTRRGTGKAWVGRVDGTGPSVEFPNEAEALRYLNGYVSHNDPEGVERGDYYVDVDRGGESESEDLVTFSTLHPDGELTGVRTIRQADIRACPHSIMAPEHYRPDGSCRCDDAEHVEMAAWGYTWDGRRWA